MFDQLPSTAANNFQDLATVYIGRGHEIHTDESVSAETLYIKRANLLLEFPCILRIFVLSLKYQLNNYLQS
jgi:hypothetical protein